MSTSANDWAQNLLSNQHAHMNWEKGTIATSFLSAVRVGVDTDDC
jgi:hypothetical protein